jgi:hypothetical protein
MGCEGDTYWKLSTTLGTTQQNIYMTIVLEYEEI